MKAAVFRGNGRIAAEDWPRPSIGAGELLLHLRGCGLCGSDIAKIVSPDTKAPAVFGHELVGDVVEVGAGVRGIGRGDRVVAAHHVPCGECHYCRRGSESMCRAFKESHLDPGGFAEFVRVPATNVAQATFALPAHVSDEAASFVEPLGCCLRATRRTGLQPGDALPVALETLYHRELTITATYSSSPADLAEAFRLVTTGALKLDALYTHRLPLERLEEGVTLMRTARALKVYVTP